MLSRFKQHTKWFLLVVGLLFIQQSFGYKNNLTRPIAGEEGTDARIEEGSLLFQANCASCHALNNKVVGPALAGVVDKYEEDYTWLNAWIKNNQKLIKSGDVRAKAIYDEYNGAAMNIFENLSDKEITSIVMWIDNDGDGPTDGVTIPLPPDPEPIPDSLFNNINWAIALMVLIVFVIILMIFGILELVSNITGKEIVNWNNINAYMMLVFLVGFFGLSIYEYSIHNQYSLFEIGSASEHGIELDRMMGWTWIVTLPVFFITQFLLFFFSFKYRQKPGRKAYFLSHNNNLEYVWTLIPAVVLTVLVSGGFKMWNEILRNNASEDSKHIEVFAYQFGWNARYPGEDGKLGKANYNLINGMNPLGVANKEHATGLITELQEDIIAMEAAIARIPKELAVLKSGLGGLVDDERKSQLRKIATYENGEVEDDLRLTIRARNTQIERLNGALQVEEGSMFTGEGDDDQVVGEIHLVNNQLVTLKFRARDVIHSAFLAHFRAQMNVVPGLPTEFTFKPIRSTEDMRAIKGDPEFDYYLVCNKICGNAHFNMKMKIVVEDQKSYDKWMNEQAGLFVKKEESKETDNAETESTEEGTETVALN
jgi:cytochrome c oxidase subunit 2